MHLGEQFLGIMISFGIGDDPSLVGVRAGAANGEGSFGWRHWDGQAWITECIQKDGRQIYKTNQYASVPIRQNSPPSLHPIISI